MHCDFCIYLINNNSLSKALGFSIKLPWFDDAETSLLYADSYFERCTIATIILSCVAG